MQAVPQMQAMPAAVSSAPAAAAPKAETKSSDNLITIKSPMIGTFYRKPSPDKPNFVEEGDEVRNGNVVCVIEAMKLFNEIESEVKGTIVKILVAVEITEEEVLEEIITEAHLVVIEITEAVEAIIEIVIIEILRKDIKYNTTNLNELR